MADLGRISGNLLANNLVRQGVDLAFETSLLYLDVTNKRIAVGATSSAYDLTVSGAGSLVTNNLIVDTTTTPSPNFTISSNTISNGVSSITIQPNQSSSPTIVTPGVAGGNIQFSNNTIGNTVNNGDINFTPNGSGLINFNVASTTLNVNGTFHVTGDVTFDGNISLGQANLLNLNSGIIPEEEGDYIMLETLDFLITEADDNIVEALYNLGTSGLTFATTYTTTDYVGTFNASNLQITGNTISSTNTNGDINLTANGTGGDTLWYLKFYQGSVTNVWPTPTTDTQRSVIFTPNGTGYGVINGTNAVTLPSGQNINQTLNTNGQIRQNSGTQRYEGFSSSGVVSFVNLYSYDSSNTFAYASSATNNVSTTITGASFTKTATGSSGQFTITVSPNNTGIVVGMSVTGYIGLGTGAVVTIIAGTTITLSVANAGAILGQTVTFGANALTVGSTSGLSNGLYAFGTGIAASSTITNISGLIVTLSQVATTPSGTGYFSVANPVINFTFVGGLRTGQTVSGTNIQGGTIISSWTSTSVTLSLPITGTGISVGTKVSFGPVTGQSYITPEITPGAADNTIRFATNDTVRAYINTTALVGSTFLAGNVNLSVSTISNSVSTNDLTLNPTSGKTNITSSVSTIGISGNTIPNALNSALTIGNTGTGYTKFSGTGGVVLPAGNTLQRPSSPENGTYRYNSQLGYGEVYSTSQATWIQAVGTSPVLTLPQVQDIMNLYAIVI
jgi:hypothetical protein